MKTSNFNMDLMVPNQSNKDVVFNESLLTIDNFLNITIEEFLDDIPENLASNKKYIIQNETHKNYICYKPHESKSIEYITPQTGMLFFLLKDRNFILYNGEEWEEIKLSYDNSTNSTNPTDLRDSENSIYPNISNSSSIDIPTDDNVLSISTTPSIDENFTGTNKKFEAPNNKPYFYLYLNDNTTLNFDQVTLPEITIMIKQCYNSSKSLAWPHNILWENKTPHQMTQTPNSTDIIKLYRLPETTHFLGKIIAQDFQF